MKTIIYLKRSKASDVVKKSLDQIIHDLERYGRCTTDNGRASRFLSYRFQEQRHKSPPQIYFKWHKKAHSIITLSPTVKLERLTPNKIRFTVKND